MWVYLAVIYAVKVITIPCPKDVERCSTEHTRVDTVIVETYRFCERENAAKKVKRLNGLYDMFYKNKTAKLDSIYITKE